jgi:hypothetical protein
MQYHTCLSNSSHRLKVILIPSVLFILVFLVSCPETPFSEEESKTFRFTGTVTDANSGLPIADATVQIYYDNTNHLPQEVKSTKTDQEGLYYMEYQGSTWILDPTSPSQLQRPLRLRALAEGYSTQGWAQISDSELLQTTNFQLPPLN